MSESEPTPKDVGKIFYDGREAWTVTSGPPGPVWVRVPEMDAKPSKPLKELGTQAP